MTSEVQNKEYFDQANLRFENHKKQLTLIFDK